MTHIEHLLKLIEEGEKIRDSLRFQLLQKDETIRLQKGKIKSLTDNVADLSSCRAKQKVKMANLVSAKDQLMSKNLKLTNQLVQQQEYIQTLKEGRL